MYLHRKNLEGYATNNGFLEDWDYMGLSFSMSKDSIKFKVFIFYTYMCHFHNENLVITAAGVMGLLPWQCPLGQAEVKREECPALKLPREQSEEVHEPESPGGGKWLLMSRQPRACSRTARVDILPKASPILGQKGAVLGSSQSLYFHL